MTTNGSDVYGYTAPILVLGLGKDNSGDDGLGAVLLDELAKRYRYAGRLLEFVAGGTRSLDLLGRIAGRPAVLILDAVAIGNQPGAISVLQGFDALRYATDNAPTVHAGDARELLATAAFLGDLPEHFYLVGMRPADLHEGNRFSTGVAQGLQSAITKAQTIVDKLLVELAEPVQA